MRHKMTLIVLASIFLLGALPVAGQVRNSAYDPLAQGAKCDGSSDDSAAFKKIVTAAGAVKATITLPKARLCVLTTLTIPSNITVDFSGAQGIKIMRGSIVTLGGPVVAKPVKIFFNALPSEGTVLFTGTAVPTFYSEWWGSQADDAKDSTAAIVAAVAAVPVTGGRLLFLPSKTYKVSDRIILKSNLTLEGHGATIDAGGISSRNDTFLIQGSNSPGQEAHDVTIAGLTMINNRFQYQIDVFGWSFTYHPHNINIKDIVTSGSTITGALYVNIGSYIRFENCVNVGGTQHIGVEAPVKQPGLTHHIWITNNRTTATTQYGYQVVYGTNYSIEGNKVDGSNMNSSDQSGIVVDRSTNAVLKGNTVDNCPIANILVTGSSDVAITQNTLSGGGSGINVSFNFEDKLDNTINESYRITVSNNFVKSFSPKHNGIVFNGVQDSSIVGNTIAGGGEPNVCVLVMDGQRPGDGRRMTSKEVTFADNSVGGVVQFAVGSPVKVGKNQVGKYTGAYRSLN
jgi:polygalacturonase